MKTECEKVEHISYSTKCSVKKYCCKKMEHAMTCIFDFEWGGKNSKQKIWKSASYGYTLEVERGGIRLNFVQTEDHYDGCRKEIEPTFGLISFCPFCGEAIE